MVEFSYLRLIYDEENGKPLSYECMSYSESCRIMGILEALVDADEWVRSKNILIVANRTSVTRSLVALAGAVRIDMIAEGRCKTFATGKVIYLRQSRYNARNNYDKRQYYRPTLYVKKGKGFPQSLLCAQQGGRINNTLLYYLYVHIKTKTKIKKDNNDNSLPWTA